MGCNMNLKKFNPEAATKGQIRMHKYCMKNGIDVNVSDKPKNCPNIKKWNEKGPGYEVVQNSKGNYIYKSGPPKEIDIEYDRSGRWELKEGQTYIKDGEEFSLISDSTEIIPSGKRDVDIKNARKKLGLKNGEPIDNVGHHGPEIGKEFVDGVENIVIDFQFVDTDIHGLFSHLGTHLR